MRILCANWKMNLSIAESCKLSADLSEIAPGLKKTQVWAASNAAALSECAKAANKKVKIGAQNTYFESKGAFTGELSPDVLLETGATFSLVGHSERRNIFGESDELCSKRALGLLEKGIEVLFCIGEKLEDREKGLNQTVAIIEKQMAGLFETLNAKPELASKLILAYEPVWAIGTGLSATTAQIAETHAAIAELWAKYSKIECPKILYGGSVSGANAAEIFAVPLVAGALVGGASNKFETFNALVQISEQH